jgi:hypothetical protein
LWRENIRAERARPCPGQAWHRYLLLELYEATRRRRPTGKVADAIKVALCAQPPLASSTMSRFRELQSSVTEKAAKQLIGKASLGCITVDPSGWTKLYEYLNCCRSNDGKTIGRVSVVR